MRGLTVTAESFLAEMNEYAHEIHELDSHPERVLFLARMARDFFRGNTSPGSTVRYKAMCDAVVLAEACARRQNG